MNNAELLNNLAPVFQEVARQLHEHLASDVPYVIDVSRHILFSGGKHLRPTLFALCARLCGLRDGRELYFSPVFEYLHAATLLHDDVIDESPTRRGQTSAHLVYGNAGVILVGDFLLAKSTGLGAATGMLEFTEVMSRTVARMAEGEILQMQNARNPELTEDEYTLVIHRKTGVLIQSACYLGGLLAGAPVEARAALKAYGRALGLAFQIVDDCLDYAADSRELGKPVCQDLEEGKVTLPLIETLKAAPPEERAALCDLIRLEERNPEQLERVMASVKTHGGVPKAMARAGEYAEEARKALGIFPDSPDKELLDQLTMFVVTRRK